MNSSIFNPTTETEALAGLAEAKRDLSTAQAERTKATRQRAYRRLVVLIAEQNVLGFRIEAAKAAASVRSCTWIGEEAS